APCVPSRPPLPNPLSPVPCTAKVRLASWAGLTTPMPLTPASASGAAWTAAVAVGMAVGLAGVGVGVVGVASAPPVAGVPQAASPSANRPTNTARARCRWFIIGSPGLCLYILPQLSDRALLPHARRQRHSRCRPRRLGEDGHRS